MSKTALAVVESGVEPFIDREKVELIKNSILKGASDLELQLFISWCNSKQLDPLSGEAYAVRQGGALQPASTIAGMRKIAARSGAYGPQDGPYWCGQDGQWTDVWLQHEPPAAAKVGVKRTDQDAYTYSVATDRECGANKAGRGGPWATQPAHMLSIRAEAAALRRVFPAELSGVYDKEELEGDERPARAPRPAEAQESRPRPIVEVVDGETGEIETAESLAAEIKALREVLGHTQADVADHAKAHGWNLRSVEGLRALRDDLRVAKAEFDQEGQAALPMEADFVDASYPDRWTQ